MQNETDTLQKQKLDQEKKVLFEHRLKKSKILVIGASYEIGDYEFWSTLDPNYIGLANAIGEQILNMNNPLSKDWNNLTHIREFQTAIHPHKFSEIYFDRATLHHIDEAFLPPMMALITILLHQNGQIILPFRDEGQRMNSIMGRAYSGTKSTIFDKIKEILNSTYFEVCDASLVLSRSHNWDDMKFTIFKKNNLNLKLKI